MGQGDCAQAALADWKSAIQQVGNLRYKRGACVWPGGGTIKMRSAHRRHLCFLLFVRQPPLFSSHPGSARSG